MKYQFFTYLCIIVINLKIPVIAQQPRYPIPSEDRERYNKKIIPSRLPYGPNTSAGILKETQVNFREASLDTILKTIKASAISPGTGSISLQTSLAPRDNVAAKLPASESTCFRLSKDILFTSTTGSDPFNAPTGNTTSFAVINNVSYFSADDYIHGRELWRSDGTEAGTYLVKDIIPGVDGYVQNIVAANGLLYFAAYTKENGMEPWVSDGTEAGTHILKDIKAGTDLSYPTQFVNAGGTVFFVTYNSFYFSTQLWKTDGTENGTSLVRDMGDFSQIVELTAVNNDVFFSTYDFSFGYQLFKSDGTFSGTTLLTPGVPYVDFPLQLTSYDNKLYFSANDGTGRRLWSSDGTVAGTHFANGFNDVYIEQIYLDPSLNKPFPILNSVLYLSGNTPADGNGLYKYDASNNDGIVLVKDLAESPGNSVVVPPDARVVNNLLYFKAINFSSNAYDELWVTAGDASNTTLVKSFEPGEYIYNFAVANGNFFFVKFDLTNGNELWKSNGTNAGTTIVKDIQPGSNPSYPENLTFCNNKLLFRAIEDVNGAELWSSDGSESGTKLVKDINKSTLGSYAGSFYKGISETANGVMFAAFTPDKNYELYKSDGTANGTVLLNEITPGTDGSYPNSFIYKNGYNYFIGDNSVGTTIYSSNGTSAGLKKLVYDIDRSVYYVTNFAITDNGMPFYILGNKNSYGFELWRSNGTQSGTIKLASGLAFDSYLVTIGNTVYFIADDGIHGIELWKSDGTIAGTKMVSDIYPGFNSSGPYSLIAYKKEVYFGAYDGVGLNYQLWKSDGSQKGTVKLKNITPARYDYVNNPNAQVFCISDNTLYFSATDLQAFGAELWKTNGTANGTQIVKDINPQGYSYPFYLTDVNGTLFFSADDGVTGTELWKSKGSSNNTELVKDINPSFGSYPFGFCGVGSKVFFINGYDGHLWSTDGTATNTKEETGTGTDGLSNFGKLVNGSGKLFFGAFSFPYGYELFVGEPCNPTGSRPVVISDLPVQAPVTEFDALVYPNPSHGPASVKIAGAAKNVMVTVTDVSGRIYWQSKHTKGYQIDLPVERLAKGVYIITVKSSDGNKSMKFIKQ